MKNKLIILSVTILILLNSSWKTIDDNWICEPNKGYTLCFTVIDEKYRNEYKRFIVQGISEVQKFFKGSYKQEFNVFIHPNRKSLDSTWQKDWNTPGFKSECWMVASGVNSKLDMLSPQAWSKEACEHVYSETKRTQQLITHELIHVYHGQLNASPDFSDVEGVDWFIEGLATYASGQCNAERMAEVKKAISANKFPGSLDDFWTGNLKYGFSGSMVMYLDHKFGRAKIQSLSCFNRKQQILSALSISESALINDWKVFVENL